MSASQAPRETTARPTRPSGHPEDSSFEASAFDSSPGRDTPTRWIGWRRRALVVSALLACLLAFSLARLLASSPSVDATWSVNPDSQIVLKSSPLPMLQAQAGQVLVGVRGTGMPELMVDALALHRAIRWQVSDQRRLRQIEQQQALSAAFAAGHLQLRFGNGAVVALDSSPRGYAALGVLFWPLIGLGLMVYLFGVVLLLARPQPTSLLFVTMTLCQGINLWLIALESAPGLGACASWLTGQMGLRVGLDLCTGAAALHALVLQPHRLERAGIMAAAGWLVLLAWLALAHSAAMAAPGALGPLWVWAQCACLALGGASWLAISHSYRLELNPYALVMRRFAATTVVTLMLLTAVVAATADLPVTGASTAEGASVAWYVFVSSLLLLTPSVAHTRLVLREFALLAGISTVATALDLLFVAVFSLGSYTSLAMAVFIALGLYAGARQWVVSHLLGSSMLTTERTFDQLYRAAREVQLQPARYPQVMGALLRDLFEPLEEVRVTRAPRRSKVTRGGAVLVVPMRAQDDDGAPTSALALRFANRGQRLFTAEDARLADRVVDQLRRAAAYDLAVERGRSEERQRIAQDLHDDIGARLLTLMYQAQSREMEDYIRHTLQDLKTLTRGLAASEHRLSHACAEWKSDLTQRLTAAHATLNWSFSADEDLALSVVQWSALTRVLRELVSNSLYHGHASSIEVLFNLKETQLTLQVADDGTGSSPQDWAHGLGLGGVRKRVKLLGGKVAWRENTPRGIVCDVLVAEFGRRN